MKIIHITANKNMFHRQKQIKSNMQFNTPICHRFVAYCQSTKPTFHTAECTWLDCDEDYVVGNRATHQ